MPISSNPAGMPTTNPATHVEKSGVEIRGMHAAENFGKESVARHGEPDARLADLEDQQGRDHSHQRADEDDKTHVPKVEFLERIDNWRGVVEERVPFDQASEDDDYADIEECANDERGDDAEREVALRVVTFFGGGGDGIKPDVREKNDRAAGQYAGPAIWRERMPVGRVNESRCKSRQRPESRRF